MDEKFVVKIPVILGKVTVKKQYAASYVLLETGRTYHPEKKYTTVQRKMIGKVCPDNPEFMIPNDNYFELFPQTEQPEQSSETRRSCCLKLGPYLVIKKVLEYFNLKPMLEPWFNQDTGLLLDLASYFIINEDNATQYFPEYAYCHPLFTEGMQIKSDSKVSRFFSHVTKDQIIGFLSDWNKVQDHRQKIYITYDATNKNCEAGEIDIVEYGNAKDNKDLPIFNLAVAFDKTNKVPLFYEQYPGSITDNSQFCFFVDKVKDYGYSHIGFILDRGYFSKENIQYMDEQKYSFLIMVKGCKALVCQLIEKYKGEFETDSDCYSNRFQVYGKSIEHPLFSDDKKPRYFHLFFSARKMAAERAEFEKKINEAEKALEKSRGHAVQLNRFLAKHFDCIFDKQNILVDYKKNKQAYRQHLDLCGYFCLISSDKMSALEALELYKGRDVSEKLFRSDKTFLGARTMRVQSVDSLSTKIFVEFIALIIRNRIYNLLKEEMLRLQVKKNYMTVPAAIKELEKIEMVRRTEKGYRLDHAVTRTQKHILQAFAMTAEDVIKGSLQVAQILKNQKNEKVLEEQQDDDEDEIFEGY